MEASDSGLSAREQLQYRQTIGDDVVGIPCLIGGQLRPLSYTITVHTRGLRCIAIHGRRTIGRVQALCHTIRTRHRSRMNMLVTSRRSPSGVA
jgi:hypothetical protein